MRTVQKNNYIEFLRFLFCTIIVIHHSYTVFPSGAFAVEFFYIITGYFAIKHINNDDRFSGMTSSVKYTVRKLLRLAPYTTLAIVGAYLLEFLYDRGIPLLDRLKVFQNLPSEMLLLPMTGQIEISFSTYRCPQFWFLSCMLIALPIVLFLASRFTDVFKGYLVWFLPFMLIAYIGNTSGSLFNWGSPGLFLYCGTIRALADLLLGGAAYYTVNAIKAQDKKKGTIRRIIFTFIEIMFLVFVVYSCHRCVNIIYDQIFVLMIIWGMLVISLSGISYSDKLFSGFLTPVWQFLGRLSMPVFCLHITVFRYLNIEPLYGLGYYAKLALMFLICIVVYCTVDMIRKLSARVSS